MKENKEKIYNINLSGSGIELIMCNLADNIFRYKETIEASQSDSESDQEDRAFCSCEIERNLEMIKYLKEQSRIDLGYDNIESYK